MTRLRILHISDLHARADWTEDQQEIVNAMLFDVQTFAASQAFDFAIFSGDLTFSGQPDEFDLARRVLLRPLAAKVDLAPSQIVIVPGNHDVSRPLIDRLDDAGLASLLTSREAVNALLDDPQQRTRATARLAHFEAFHADYFGDDEPAPLAPLSRWRAATIRGTHVGIVALNSAWRCADDHDKGRLLLGDRQTRRSLEALDDCDVRIVVMHHPLAWLAGFDAASARVLFERKRCIVLTGHEHESDPTSEMRASGQAVYSRAGCLYESHAYPNSYTILDIDTNLATVDVFVRSWWAPARREFDKAVHLASDGRLTFPLPNLSTSTPVRDARSAPASGRATPSRVTGDTAAAQDTMPPEIRAASLRAYTPLYKTYQRYTFDVREVVEPGRGIRVTVGVTYGIVNPTSMRLEHRPGLTPVRPIRVTRASIGDREVDLSNSDFHTERGLVVPVALPPQSETCVDLWGEIDYRLPDSEVFLTYLPALSYEVALRSPAGRLRFIGEALMPEHLTRVASADGPEEEIVYRATGAVLAYWGLKLDWVPADRDTDARRGNEGVDT